MNEFRLFTGTSHPTLAQEIALQLGVPLGSREIHTFPDGETFVQILENVRGKDVFLVQPVIRRPNSCLMELFIMVDALKRASARSVGVVIPYFGYSRQDRKDRARVPITAKLVANLLETSGVDRVLTMDLHAGQLQGFFDVPVDNLYARPSLVHAIKQTSLEGELVCVAPDVGSTKLAKEFADDLGANLGVIGKRRLDANNVEVTTLVGDVKGKHVVLVDDICSTAGTLVSAASACKEAGAKTIYAAVTHGLFVGQALQKLQDSAIDAVFASNTVPLPDPVKNPKVKGVSVASLFAEALKRIQEDQSISSMFAQSEKVKL